MKTTILAVAATLMATSAFAQTQSQADLIALATANGACPDTSVATAVLNAEDNTLAVTCNEDVVAFVPLLGGFAPVLGLGAAAAAGVAALANSGSTSDSQ